MSLPEKNADRTENETTTSETGKLSLKMTQAFESGSLVFPLCLRVFARVAFDSSVSHRQLSSIDIQILFISIARGSLSASL